MPMGYSRPNFVRLLAAVAACIVSVLFINAYSALSHTRFKIEHEGENLIALADVTIHYGRWLYAFPFLPLAVGLWLVFRRPLAVILFELLLSGTWLLALILVLFCLLIWLAQNVPVFNLMKRHY